MDELHRAIDAALQGSRDDEQAKGFGDWQGSADFDRGGGEYQKLMNFINREGLKVFITIYNVSGTQYQPKTRREDVK